MDPKSEYQRKFGLKREMAKESYEEMVNFRRRKKSSEYRHTPIIWLDMQKEDEKKELNETYTNVVSKHDISVPVLSTPCCKAIQTSETALTKDVAVQSPERRRKSQRQAKRKIKNLDKAQKENVSPINHEKPIIAYGWADKTSVWKKRTFNVKAPTSYVRQSALRAENQREKNLKLKLTRKERLANEKLKTQVLLDSITNFNQWQTEYQKQFCT